MKKEKCVSCGKELKELAKLDKAEKGLRKEMKKNIVSVSKLTKKKKK